MGQVRGQVQWRIRGGGGTRMDQEDSRRGREAPHGGRPRGLREKPVVGGACLFILMGNSPSFNEVLIRAGETTRGLTVQHGVTTDDSGLSRKPQTECAEALPECL